MVKLKTKHTARFMLFVHNNKRVRITSEKYNIRYSIISV